MLPIIGAPATTRTTRSCEDQTHELKHLRDTVPVRLAQSRQQSATSRGTQLATMTWPLLLTMTLMLLLSIASMSTLSSLRAYVNGEGLWSKAERQAVADLHRYSTSGAEADFERFQSQLAVPLGDRLARLQLQSAQPDPAVAARGLLAGHNDPADIAGMIRLFRLFRSSSIMAHPIQFWTQGDELILQLADIGDRLHAELAVGHATPAHVALLLAAADQVHVRVAPLEDGFSAALGFASRKVTSLLMIALAACSAALVCAAIAILRGHLRRSERMAAALRATRELVFIEQERSHVTLGSIADAVISADRDRRIIYMNSAAERLTLWSQADAQHRDLTAVLSLEEDSRTRSVLGRLDEIAAGDEISGPTSGVLLSRRDGSQVVIHERAAPIRDRHGQVVGIVLVLRDITCERAMATRLEHQATHDPLTGLTNRQEFENRLSSAIEDHRARGTRYALLYLDLDQFKVINDTCGHAAGDQLLRKVAWLIKDHLRGCDVLARLGGDEFGALLPGIDSDDAVALADRVRRRIAELRFNWESRVFAVNASIGVIAIDTTLAGVDDALSGADQACYLAKDSGRNRVQLYRPDDQQVRTRHGEMRWVERLNAALDNDSFVLLAQEIRSIGSSTGGSGPSPVHRCELLLRMVAPDGTWVPPMAFIPAAERYGLMPRVDRWVIAQACRELADLRSKGHSLPVCMLNLSGASVTDPSLADYISGCLRQHALPASQVGFELTETAAICNLASASELMAQLRKLGSPVALDDFGSGMSSFSYLKALPIDYLKIDGAFVRNVGTDAVDRAVVEAIHRIGRVMGIQTVAECVEDEAALRALMAIGVDHAQGFHISKPTPLAEMGAAARYAPAVCNKAAISPVRIPGFVKGA
jgi:diguanylate cyclase (GGDEF)-like protein/PAS domain S-box-containing protein